MGTVSGGELFVRSLKKEGVRYIFTLCGGHIAPILNACLDEGIGVIDVRHEEVAAHAAAGWSRVTGQPGVAVVTAGPGVTNSVTGVAEAFTANCPMVEFGGRSPLAEFEIGSLQDLDQVSILQPVTKWSKTIFEARRIPEYVGTAFRKAKNGTPGPVYIECPQDVLAQKVEETAVELPANYYAEDETCTSPELVAAALDLLMAAERPVVVAGDGLFWSGADAALREFVEVARLPVLTTGFARGAVPDNHPLATGFVGTAMADAILSLGVNYHFAMSYGQPPRFHADAKFIQVSNDGTTIGYNRRADLGIVASAKGLLRQLAEEFKARGLKPKHGAWADQLTSIAGMLNAQAAEPFAASTLPVHPARLAAEVCEFLDPDAIAVPDGGDSYAWFSGRFQAQRMGQLVGTGPFGCLGVGPGFALAAKLAHPEKQVLLYSGDGSFGLNAMEFDTFVRHGLPIVAVISNDSAWGMVRQVHCAAFGEDRTKGTTLKNRQRYDKVVEALGGHGEYVERIEEIKPALARAFASGRPACVNVAVDPKPMSAVTAGFVAAMQ